MANFTTWVVIANGSQAKIFQVVKFPKLKELDLLVHPSSRLKNQDLVTSEEGRTFESTGTSRSAYEPSIDPHHQELEKFARTLGEYLANAKQSHAFSRLYVMASPTFLGLLRPHLAFLQGSIVAEIDKDMTGKTLNEIEAHLSNVYQK